MLRFLLQCFSLCDNRSSSQLIPRKLRNRQARMCKCRQCESPISLTADACPQCGEKDPFYFLYLRDERVAMTRRGLFTFATYPALLLLVDLVPVTHLFVLVGLVAAPVWFFYRRHVAFGEIEDVYRYENATLDDYAYEHWASIARAVGPSKS